jgi:predicted deacylase
VQGDINLSRVFECEPVDISNFRNGNAGIPYVVSIDSGQPGPHVQINALTHGNEVCGAAALCALRERKVRPNLGRLTFSFANVAAYERFDPNRPFASRYIDEDLNRVWAPALLNGPRTSVELARARTLRPLVDNVDFLLDLHSTALPAPPMLLCGRRKKGLQLARSMGFPAYVIADAGHAAGPRMRDYGAFDDDASPKTAMLVECGQHFAATSKNIAVETALRFLLTCGVIDRTPSGLLLPSRYEHQKLIRVSHAVTIETERFFFADDYRCFDVVSRAGTVIARDGSTEVRTPYDNCVLVMPTRQPVKGQTAVRLGCVASWDND